MKSNKEGTNMSTPEQQDSDQDNSIIPRRWRIAVWIAGVLGIFLFLLVLLVGDRALFPAWTGLNQHTLWDLAELFIIPIALATIAFFFNRVQSKDNQRIAADERETEQGIARDRNEEAELRNYFDRMSELMLTHNLRPQPGHNENKEPDTTNYETASTIARARTLAVLRSIQDRDRKASVVQFLYESGLIQKKKTVVHLLGADLQGVCLKSTFLQNADLRGADLRSAVFQGITPLHAAMLQGADLREADLQEAKLFFADLREADLRGADLRRACLAHADLRGADLRHAFLANATLISAKLQKAKLQDSTMPETILHGAFLQEAELQRVIFYKTNLCGAHLKEANLCEAKLHNAKIDEHTNFDGARYDSGTTPPPGGFPDL
jgi:uncharacterized protein YjbI with pentapeptide repeats